MITKEQIPISETSVDVSEHAIDLPVDVSDFTQQRVQSFDAHHTQFSKRVRIAYKIFVHSRKTEQFIIARNRHADILLQKCFDINADNTQNHK
jgi:hypothetical protein